MWRAREGGREVRDNRKQDSEKINQYNMNFKEK